MAPSLTGQQEMQWPAYFVIPDARGKNTMNPVLAIFRFTHWGLSIAVLVAILQTQISPASG